MKNIILAMILTAASVSAYATNPPNNVIKGGKAIQDQKQKQKQTQKATGGEATAEGGKGGDAKAAQVVTISDNEVMQHKNTPDLGSVVVYPTANCRVAHGGGVVGAGFGVQYGSSTPDDVCQLIELSKRMEQLNRPRAAILVMCEEPRAARALGDECPPIKVSRVETPIEVVRP